MKAKKKMKNTVVALAVAASLLCFGVVQAASTTKAQAALWAMKKDRNKVPFLFVLTMARASFKHLNGQKYELIVKQQQVTSFLGFSDRPARISFQVPPAQFFPLIEGAKRSFKKDPPNVVLEFKGGVNAVFEVNRYKVKKGTILLHLKHLGSSKLPKAYVGKMVVFVDGDTCFNNLVGSDLVDDEAFGDFAEAMTTGL